MVMSTALIEKINEELETIIAIYSDVEIVKSEPQTEQET
jgi:hypothetical protein